MIPSDAFYLLFHDKRWHPDEDPVVLGRYFGLPPADVETFTGELVRKFYPNDVWVQYESEIGSEQKVRELRAEADRMSDRVQAHIRSGTKGTDEVREALYAYYLFRQHEGKGPYGDGQWMDLGRISSGRLTPKPFALAKLLYERIDEQVLMDTVIGEGRLFDDGTDYATIGRQCSSITTFFRDEKMPLRVESSSKNRTMIMKSKED